MSVYFNEIEPFCAQWLRNQFGDVDERDIRQIERPVDAIRQHYFAGLGGWEWALRLAGWPADQEVWTGSCPCQPFSVAGKGQAHEDERDLWPAFFRLIAIARPAVIIGEQVNGAITYGWLDRVCDDLEGIGYAVGAAVLPAGSVGAPHIRQRLYWVAVRLADRDGDGALRAGGAQLEPAAEGADSGLAVADSRRMRRSAALGENLTVDGMAQSESQLDGRGQPRARRRPESTDGGATGRMGNADRPGREARDPVAVRARPRPQQFAQPGLFDGLELTSRNGWGKRWSESERGRAEPRRDSDGMGGSDHQGSEGRYRQSGKQPSQLSARDAGEAIWMADPDSAASARYREHGRSGPSQPEPESHWTASRSIYCADGRWRRIPLEPSFQPLADSGRFGNPRIDPNLSSRIGALQAAGNAIVIPLAAEFIRAVMELLE